MHSDRADADGWNFVRSVNSTNSKNMRPFRPSNDTSRVKSNWRNSDDKSDRKNDNINEKKYRQSKKSESQRLYSSQSKELIPKIIKENIAEYGSIDITSLKTVLLREINSLPNPFAKAKFIEILVSYHFWEMLSQPEFVEILKSRDIHEKDGHSAMHWVNWPTHKKQNIPDYSRNKEDVIKTIKILYDAEYSPMNVNCFGETVIESLQNSISDGYIPKEWFADIKYMYTYPPEQVAEIMLRKIGSKITTENSDNYRVAYCWIFKLYPNIATLHVIKPCLLLDVAMKDKCGHWNDVTKYVSMYRNLIKYGPKIDSKEYGELEDFFVNRQNPWNSEKYLALFDDTLGYEASNFSSFKNTMFPDPIAGIVGECNNKQIQKEYMLRKLSNQKTINLAIYCLSHSKNFDSDVMKIIIENFDTLDTKLKYTIMSIVERDYSKKIIDLTDLKNTLLTTYVSIPIVDDDEDTKNEDTEEIPYDISYDDKLTCITNIDKLPSNDMVKNNIVNIFTTLFNSTNDHHILMENIIVKIMENVGNTESLISIINIIKSLELNGTISTESIKDASNKLNKIKNVLSDYIDSPKWIIVVLQKFSTWK